VAIVGNALINPKVPVIPKPIEWDIETSSQD
jgi:hypothetical protein